MFLRYATVHPVIFLYLELLSFVLIKIFTLLFNLKVSAIDHDIIEVDPDTKEMLKMLVSKNPTGYKLWEKCLPTG